MNNFVITTTVLVHRKDGVGYRSINDWVEGVDKLLEYIKRNLEVDFGENEELMSVMFSPVEESSDWLASKCTATE